MSFNQVLKFFKTTTFRSLAVTLVGTLPLLSSFILVPYYTKFLSVESYGLLALYISLTLLFQIIVSFSLETFIAINHYKTSESIHDYNKLVSSGSIAQLLFGLFFLLILFVFFKMLSLLGIFDFIRTELLMLSGITAVMNSIFKNQTTLLIHKQNIKQYFILNSSFFLLNISLNLIYLLCFHVDIDGIICCRLISATIISLFVIYNIHTNYGLLFDPKCLSGLFSYCIPLVILNLSNWIFNYFNNFVIMHFDKPSNVALYDLAMKLVIPLELIQNGFSAIVAPKIYKKWSTHNHLTTENKQFELLMNGNFSMSTILLTSIITLFIPIFVNVFLHKKDYLDVIWISQLLLIGLLFRHLYNLYTFQVYYNKNTASLLSSFLKSAIIHLISSVILISNFGLQGSIISFYISKIGLLVFLHIDYVKVNTVTKEFNNLYVAPSLYFFTYIILFVFIGNNFYLFEISQFLVAISIISIFYMNEAKSTFKSLIKH
ncbi:MAG: oligosaccharide flippase family protein [Cytophagales bacterium]